MNFLEYINPINWAKAGIDMALVSLLESLVSCSYWMCIIGGLIGLFLYIFGYEKGKNYPFISIGIYLIINILGAVIIGA